MLVEKDPMTAYVRAKYDLMDKLGNELAESMKGMDLLHKTYVRGLCEMYSPEPHVAGLPLGGGVQGDAHQLVVDEGVVEAVLNGGSELFQILLVQR